MSIITIISHGPKGNGKTTPTEHDFDTVEAAVEFLHSLPIDALPSGDGSSES